MFQFSNIQNVEVNNVLSTVTPSLSVDQDAVCDGQTIELNSSTYVGSNIQYLWWFDAGNGPNLIATTAIPTLFIPDASSANSGIYTVSVTMGLCETAPSNAQDIVVSDTYLGQTPQLSVGRHPMRVHL
ncbi:MAG: hypothetical protein R2788_23645 [Saprospiraceae bacterium]